ncbi:DUF3341 domain-containing protein [Algisphaera agarilytica]|uniref:DUF3341 domain-containing protein n=1 Tax=Algisphaera agarilytica TaxID=1385975 RepID=A0A7X0H531_9BACT|nr:DUF3341 domain-containing protein [Algisphaera agarilytica]MBB6429447.1 hypothetical protein [Algisphaera agarilytica]
MSVIDAPITESLPQEAAVGDDVKVYGIIAEYDNVGDVIEATQAAYDAGYRKMDVHSPFPIHGIDEALGVKPTILPWLVLGMGLTGMTTGILLTTFTMTDFMPVPDAVPTNFEGYRYLISGKPFNSFAAFIPVIFELTIMFSAYTAVFAMFLLNKLPLLYHPLFNSKHFRRATQDRFFLAIESQDRNFDADQTAAFLKEHKALSTELINE